MQNLHHCIEASTPQSMRSVHFSDSKKNPADRNREVWQTETDRNSSVETVTAPHNKTIKCNSAMHGAYWTLPRKRSHAASTIRQLLPSQWRPQMANECTMVWNAVLDKTVRVSHKKTRKHVWVKCNAGWRTIPHRPPYSLLHAPSSPYTLFL